MKIDNEFTVSVPIAYRAVIDAKLKDPGGAGNASAVITAGLSPKGTTPS
jgi:hypothetical protein